jgi:hypothetical protein
MKLKRTFLKRFKKNSFFIVIEKMNRIEPPNKFSRITPCQKRKRCKAPHYITDTCIDNINIIINYNGSDVFTLKMCSEDTFEKIKLAIQERFTLSNTNFDLSYNGVIINSLRRLCDYNIQSRFSRTTLYCIL